jgi:hypothetical protein
LTNKSTTTTTQYQPLTTTNSVTTPIQPTLAKQSTTVSTYTKFKPTPTIKWTNNHSRPSSNAATIVCNKCGRVGHYALNCSNSTRSSQNNRASDSQSSNNENTAPHNQQRAYFVTYSGNSQPQSDYHHHTFKASSLDHLADNHSNTPWPNPSLPQMTINPPLLDRDYLPTATHAPPKNSGATEYFPDDPHLRTNALVHHSYQIGYLTVAPPATILHSSVTSATFNPAVSPSPLPTAAQNCLTHKGTTECHFTTDDGLKSILGLTDVNYVEGLSHRLLSLTALSCTQNFSVFIKNRATTIQLPNGSTYTWPILNNNPTQPYKAFSTISSPPSNFDLDSDPDEQHFDDSASSLDPDHNRSIISMPLELISR